MVHYYKRVCSFLYEFNNKIFLKKQVPVYFVVSVTFPRCVNCLE